MAIAPISDASPAPTSVRAASGNIGETTTNDNNVIMRSCAKHTCKQTGYLAISGSVVYVYCWVRGENINGDSIWYSAGAGNVQSGKGYVAGYYLNTGHDPKPGIPAC